MSTGGEYDKQCLMTTSSQVFAKCLLSTLRKASPLKAHMAIQERGSWLHQIRTKFWKPPVLS